MSTDRWARIDAILQAALLRSPESREAFVREASDGDTALADEALSLLAHASSVDGFLEPAPGATKAPLQPAQKLDRYEVIGHIAAGGMGEVYLAKDTRLGREVAIKVLPVEVARDRDRLARFEREAKAVSALNHPHIVTLYEVGSSDSGPYLVLEKVDGRSLREVLHDGPLPIKRVLQLVTQIAEGMAKAHAAGIVHRDLKPENIMVTGDGFAKILDFGLAKLVLPGIGADSAESTRTLAQGTASGVILGTLGYLSPEQAAGKPADYRADQFAMGALLYEMVTRDRPFKRATLMQSLAATISDELEPVRSKRPDAPAPLEWLIERCLAKDPNDRYTSTADLARELASLRDHLPDLSRLSAGNVAPIPERVWTLGRLGWAVVALAAAGVAAVAFIVGRRSVDNSLPSYHPLTFQRGLITGARFGPDGRTVYYSAAFGTEPSRTFVTHLDRTESTRLDHVPPGFLLGVSSKNELAVLLTNERSTYSSVGTLARVPALGGTTHPLIDGVIYADWAADGDRLAITRPGGQCEFPIGFRLEIRCGLIRLSPRGDAIAIPVNSGLEVQDMRGNRMAFADMPHAFGHAWSPDGREVWFTGSETDSPNDRALYALGVTGGRRLIARAPGAISIYDVAPDGRGALVTTGAGWYGINYLQLDSAGEKTLDQFGRTDIVGLSSDGKYLLVNESREAGRGTWFLSTDGASRIKLPSGIGSGLSPDGALAVIQPRGDATRLTLVPTGAGSAKEIRIDAGFELVSGAIVNWSPDGRRFFAWIQQAKSAEPSARLYVREGDRPWRPITPVLTPGDVAIAPDGEAVAARDPEGVVTLFYLDRREPRRLEGERGRPILWSADGGHLLLSGPALVPASLYHRAILTGRVTPWRSLAPADLTGTFMVGRVLVARNERSLVYQYTRGLNDLYLVRGLK